MKKGLVEFGKWWYVVVYGYPKAEKGQFAIIFISPFIILDNEKRQKTVRKAKGANYYGSEKKR